MYNKFIKIAALTTAIFVIGGCFKHSDGAATEKKNGETSLKENINDYSEIYLAGGCFWGTQKYFDEINGVTATEAGYANSVTENPTYEQVCSGRTNAAETVKVIYDPDKIGLPFILRMYYKVIDPTSLNKQGNDRGTQYRTGIYYTDPEDEKIIKRSLNELAKNYSEPIAIETDRLKNFYPAEEYHQKFLEKNPDGYCHIGKDKLEEARTAKDESKQDEKYSSSSKEELRKKLSPMQFAVTQDNKTEPPFKNEYWDKFEPGIYVDITTGEPLFSSTDKFESGCGWPSFSKPIDPKVVSEHRDSSHGMTRTEVRSKTGNAHLGHVFNDGPKELGGDRYCINSASLRFVPKNKMQDEGYGYLLPYVK